MKPFIISFFLLWVINLSAQVDFEKQIKPRYGIHLVTMEGNMLKGLLLRANDTSVIIYPGKTKDWNKEEAYYPVIFGSSRVKEIKLKKKNGAVKGMMLGGSVGLSAMLTTILLNNTTAKGGNVNTAVIVVPAGIIGGAYMGSKSRKIFNINGSEKAFSEFQKQIK